MKTPGNYFDASEHIRAVQSRLPGPGPAQSPAASPVSPDASPVSPARVHSLLKKFDDDPEVREMVRALGVIVLTPGIRAHLAANDPKALAQAERALSWEAQ